MNEEMQRGRTESERSVLQVTPRQMMVGSTKEDEGQNQCVASCWYVAHRQMIVGSTKERSWKGSNTAGSKRFSL